MSKKKINNRLDKLFDEIKSNEAETQAERPGRSGGRKPKQAPSLPSVPMSLSDEISEILSGTGMTLQADDRLAPVTTQVSPTAMLSTAFRIDEKNWSTLKVVDESGKSTWGAEEQLLVKQVADQLSLAMENARLFQETQQRVQELTTLLNVSQNLAELPLQLEEIANLIAKYFIQIFQVTECSILLLTPQGKMRTIVDYIPENKKRPEDELWTNLETDPADYPATQQMLATLQPVILQINDPSLDSAEQDYMRKYGVKSQVRLPLIMQGRATGMIHLEELYQERQFSQQELNLAMILSNQAAVALDNARLFQETQARAEELSALNRIIFSSSQTLELTQLLETLLAQILDMLGFSCGLISLKNEASGQLELFTHQNLPLPVLEKLQAAGLAGTPCDHVFKSQSTLAVSDTREGTPVDFTGLINNGLFAYLGVPLEAKGQIVGTLCVFNENPEPMSENVISLTQSIGRQIGFAIENARLFQQTQQSESELKALFAAMEDVIIIYDREGRYERIAETNPNHLFRPTEEMLGRTLQEVLPENLHEPFLSTIRTTLDTGQSQEIEYPLEINGAEYWFDASVSKLTENHVFWVARDTTERKRAEENLRESEEKYRDLLNGMNDTIWVIDFDTTILDVNNAAMTALGYSREELLSMKISDIDVNLIPEQIQNLASNMPRDKVQVFETSHRTKDGKDIPVEISSSLVSYAGRTVIMSIARDITERKQNEEALRRRNEYLAASAEIGRLVTSSLDLKAIFSRAVNLVKERFGYYHAAIFIVEETGFNAVLQEATGEAGEQMKQRGHSLTVGSKSTVGQATETGNAIVINNTALDPIHKPNPLLPDTRAEAAIPLHIGNRIIGVLDIQSTEVNAFSQDDVAILQLLADQIAIGIDNARSYNIAQQAVQEMREVDRLKSQFLANMSHELRTPLNSIIGFARVILKGIDGPVTELQQQDLTAIFNAGQHLLGLINDILDLSRIEAGKMELSFSEVNIDDLVTSVMSTAAGLIKDKPITLKQEIATDLPTVRADPMRIRQVLINLLSNAAKFTEKGEITVRAEVDDLTTGQSSVIVTVTDTGPGISPEDQAKLFQPFSQVDASLTRKVGGSGLGLSICHHLVQMHHGRIGIHSMPGRGSSFYFTVPIFVKEQKISKSGFKTILTIDDDPQILNLYERYLRPKGFQVISLKDPQRAKERVRQLKPFAVILDIMMPGYDGWHVLDDLKSDPETRSVPIIICSILEEEEKGFSLGAADYLVKPIVEDDLLSSLDRLNNDGSIREILIIDDDPNDLRLLGTMISNQGRYKPILAEGGQAGWNAIQSKTPHAIVLDLFMPDVDGFSILEKLHENNELRDIPVVVVSSSDLTNEQYGQLQMFGQRLLQKSSLQEQELIGTIENALKRIDN
ncbi:MAG: GAF domain-containing protein [Chloroflexota bacterium]